MVSVNAASNERLTWDEIEKRYPEQWVGLKNIEFEDDDASIAAAVVSEIGTMHDLLGRQLDGNLELVLYTTPDSDFKRLCAMI